MCKNYASLDGQNCRKLNIVAQLTKHIPAAISCSINNEDWQTELLQ